MYRERTIVNEGDVLEFNSLAGIHLLLELKRVVVEVLLQHLVREVDAELLKAVVLEDLEPEDIQDTNVPAVEGESEVLK